MGTLWISMTARRLRCRWRRSSRSIRATTSTTNTSTPTAAPAAAPALLVPATGLATGWLVVNVVVQVDGDVVERSETPETDAEDKVDDADDADVVDEDAGSDAAFVASMGTAADDDVSLLVDVVDDVDETVVVVVVLVVVVVVVRAVDGCVVKPGTQTAPLPTNPGMQTHENEPGMLLQTEFSAKQL